MRVHLRIPFPESTLRDDGLTSIVQTGEPRQRDHSTGTVALRHFGCLDMFWVKFIQPQKPNCICLAHAALPANGGERRSPETEPLHFRWSLRA